MNLKQQQRKGLARGILGTLTAAIIAGAFAAPGLALPQTGIGGSKCEDNSVMLLGGSQGVYWVSCSTDGSGDLWFECDGAPGWTPDDCEGINGFWVGPDTEQTLNAVTPATVPSAPSAANCAVFGGSTTVCTTAQVMSNDPSKMDVTCGIVKTWTVSAGWWGLGGSTNWEKHECSGMTYGQGFVLAGNWGTTPNFVAGQVSTDWCGASSKNCHDNVKEGQSQKTMPGAYIAPNSVLDWHGDGLGASVLSTKDCVINSCKATGYVQQKLTSSGTSQLAVAGVPIQLTTITVTASDWLYNEG